MNLRRFIGVAYACLVEEYQRLGTDLLSAIDKVGALGREGEDATEPLQAAADNAQSIAQLQAMMAGVRGSPV